MPPATTPVRAPGASRAAVAGAEADADASAVPVVATGWVAGGGLTVIRNRCVPSNGLDFTLGCASTRVDDGMSPCSLSTSLLRWSRKVPSSPERSSYRVSVSVVYTCADR